eukprot:2140647-Rhodomonas_salina.1
MVLRSASTDIGYGATSCPVLTQAMVLPAGRGAEHAREPSYPGAALCLIAAGSAPLSAYARATRSPVLTHADPACWVTSVLKEGAWAGAAASAAGRQCRLPLPRHAPQDSG